MSKIFFEWKLQDHVDDTEDDVGEDVLVLTLPLPKIMTLAMSSDLPFLSSGKMVTLTAYSENGPSL